MDMDTYRETDKDADRHSQVTIIIIIMNLFVRRICLYRISECSDMIQSDIGIDLNIEIVSNPISE